MDYEKVIRAIIEPLVANKDSIMIRKTLSENGKDITILIVAEKEDTSRLIGRRGIVANAIREVASVGGKSENKRIHIHFESFDEKDEEEK
ncbi:MAG: KH domain-containing protein [Erysipelotrichia bacterium]|nr:KH domain-containing protein [Erysipelotrichia bacterium]